MPFQLTNELKSRLFMENRQINPDKRQQMKI